jgi:hypothetical protein
MRTAAVILALAALADMAKASTVKFPRLLLAFSVAMANDEENTEPVCKPPSPDDVCKTYASSGEAVATTPALGGVGSVVAGLYKYGAPEGTYFIVTEGPNPKRYKKKDRSKYKLKDSNGGDPVLILPGYLRPVTDEETANFEATVKIADAAKARSEKLPDRLGGAPPTFPGVVVEKQPSKTETKLVTKPMFGALDLSSFHFPGSSGKRHDNGRLLDMDMGGDH